MRIVLVGVLVLMLLERYLVFFPTRDGDWSPRALRYEDAHFAAADGTKLHGWYLEHDNPRAVVLYAHGNAGNLTSRAPLLAMLRRNLRISLLIFDYRGYGRSEGSPDEQGILMDARAARRWLFEEKGIAEHDVVLWGRSLGGGVAVDLAAADGARGLILDCTFTSIPDVAARHYPWLPVRWLMRTRLDSLAKIGGYHGPLLQSHGTADGVVPIALGQRLFAAAPDPRKVFVTLEDGDHGAFDFKQYGPALEAFFDRLEREVSTTQPEEAP